MVPEPDGNGAVIINKDSFAGQQVFIVVFTDHFFTVIVHGVLDLSGGSIIKMQVIANRLSHSRFDSREFVDDIFNLNASVLYSVLNHLRKQIGRFSVRCDTLIGIINTFVVDLHLLFIL